MIKLVHGSLKTEKIKGKLKHKNKNLLFLCFCEFLILKRSFNTHTRENNMRLVKVFNNVDNIDEELLIKHFPHAYRIIKPEIIEDIDPTMDRIGAMIVDEDGRTNYEEVSLCELKSSRHWPGSFSFNNYDEKCVSRCFWVDRQYSPLCINCKYEN